MKESDSLWPNWTRGELRVHLLHTGVGESLFWIFPDGTTMLLDCGETDPTGREPAPALPDGSPPPGEWIARRVRRLHPGPDPSHVDYLMISHHHADHTQGLHDAARFLRFDKAFDRAWPDYDKPCRLSDYEPVEAVFARELFAALIDRDGLVVENLVPGRSDQVVCRHGGAEGFSVFNLCANGIVADERTGEQVDAYSTYPDKQPEFEGRQWINENGMSLGLVVRYGAFSLFTAGDFSDDKPRDCSDIEETMASHVGPVSVAKITHHGFFSMSEKLVAALRPRVFVNCVWNCRQNSEDTLRRLADRSLYPSDRFLYPTFLPTKRPCSDAPAATLAAKGCDVAVRVPPGGKNFTVACLPFDEEEQRVLFERTYLSGGTR